MGIEIFVKSIVRFFDLCISIWRKELTFAVGFENMVLPKIKNTNGEDDEGFVWIWAGDAGCGCAAI